MDLFRGTTVERVLRRGDRPTLVVRKRSGKPYRRVLVAVDFSIGSRRPLEVALCLTPDGEVFVLHGYEVPFQAFLTDPRTKQEVKAEQDQRLSKLVDAEMNAFLEQSGECRAILAQETPIDMIFGAIRELRPDLLAMGTHGRTRIARALLGSLAEEILANPPCDVVAVKGW